MVQSDKCQLVEILKIYVELAQLFPLARALAKLRTARSDVLIYLSLGR